MSGPRGRYLVSAALLLYGAAARADGADDVQSLLSESVVTTASTTAEKASSAPATSVTLTADDLRRYGFRSIAEAINFLSLGVVTSDGLRTPDIGSRGVLIAGDDGKHFLLLINGHAVNDPLYGAARFDQGAGIPLDLVDRIEVIVGPGSVLYGSNAMLGVINVITKTGSAYRGGHALGEYEPGRSWTAGAGAGFTFKLFGADSEVTAAVEHYERFGPDLDFDEQPMPLLVAIGQFIRFRRGGAADGVWGGRLRRAYFTEATSGILRLRSGDFDVTFQANRYRRGLPYITSGLIVDFDDPTSYELDRAFRVDIKHQATLSSLVQLTTRVYGDVFDYNREVNRDALAVSCLRADFETCSYFDVGVARWLGLEERISFNWLGDLSLVTLFGVDARERWVSAKQDAVDFDSGRPFAATEGRIGDGTDESAIISPYLQQTWTPVDWLDLNAGARLDIDERFDPVLSPRGAVAVRPYRKTTLRAIYSQAFRAPTWSETDIANYQVAPSDDVEPEIARSVEGSLEQRFGTQRLTFGVFRTWWQSLITPGFLSTEEQAELQRDGRLPITATGQIRYRNEANIKNYGWNGAWDGSLAGGKLSYGLNLTAAYTRHSHDDLSNGLITVAPRFFGNARVAYAFDGYLPSPALAGYYVSSRPAFEAFESKFMPIPYAEPLAEFRFTLTGEAPVIKGLSYRASAAYATGSEGPYAVGPWINRGTPVPPVLTPVDQFRFFVGLRYDFAGGSEAWSPEE
ncbi:MAG TPA: TonB-dependent receptor [Polyangiaceae bacterium]